MVELTSLRGNQMHVVALDYIKCFDRVPQGIVLEVAAQLGLDVKVHRALCGMYRTQRRAFKINGCLGSFFQATNGILQGCPLSVALINMLTTIWKRAVGSLGGGVKPQQAAGLPILEHPETQQEAYLVNALGYADDTYVVG